MSFYHHHSSPFDPFFAFPCHPASSPSHCFHRHSSLLPPPPPPFLFPPSPCHSNHHLFSSHAAHCNSLCHDVVEHSPFHHGCPAFHRVCHHEAKVDRKYKWVAEVKCDGERSIKYKTTIEGPRRHGFISKCGGSGKVKLIKEVKGKGCHDPWPHSCTCKNFVGEELEECCAKEEKEDKIRYEKGKIEDLMLTPKRYSDYFASHYNAILFLRNKADETCSPFYKFLRTIHLTNDLAESQFLVQEIQLLIQVCSALGSRRELDLTALLMIEELSTMLKLAQIQKEASIYSLDTMLCSVVPNHVSLTDGTDKPTTVSSSISKLKTSQKEIQEEMKQCDASISKAMAMEVQTAKLPESLNHTVNIGPADGDIKSTAKLAIPGVSQQENIMEMQQQNACINSDIVMKVQMKKLSVSN